MFTTLYYYKCIGTDPSLGQLLLIVMSFVPFNTFFPLPFDLAWFQGPSAISFDPLYKLFFPVEAIRNTQFFVDFGQSVFMNNNAPISLKIKSRPRCCTKSPKPIPGLISCTGVSERWRLMTAANTPTVLHFATNLQHYYKHWIGHF